jgi:hypothetical protein
LDKDSFLIDCYLVSRNDSARIFLHGEELGGVVVELFLGDVPDVLAVTTVFPAFSSGLGPMS